MNPEAAKAPAAKKSSKRRGIVLVAVLIIVASLSLAGYHYSDMMTSEYKASENALRSVQAQRLAESAVHYAAAALSNPENFEMTLNGNPWNNPDAFRDIPIEAEGKVIGRFSIIAPSETGVEPLFGVTDEGGKINLNALMKADPTGAAAYQILIKLPNMTEDIAAAIVDWMDPDSEPRPGGAENDVYMGLSPAYRCKNGPIDSIDELLLVQGVTRELLYGNDLNRNGFQDANEAGTETFDRGWAALLTVHSREPNHDASGNPYVYLNNDDLEQLYQSLPVDLDEDLAKFIIMYRQNTPSNASGQAQSTGGTIAAILGLSGNDSSGKTVEGDLSSYELKFNKSARTKINSLFDLVNAYVTITTGRGRNQVKTVYASPLNDPAKVRELFPALYAVATVTEEEQPAARININTAPAAVLAALPISENDVQKIIDARPTPDMLAGDPVYSSPAWLLTEAQIDLNTLRELDRADGVRLITTRTQVYRVQAVGHLEGNGPAMRVEAVIDANMGRPRIIAWRELSELGKGLDTTAQK